MTGQVVMGTALGLFAALATASAPQWLYFTGQGAWVEHQLAVEQYPVLVDIPKEASDLWWQMLPEDQQVTRVRTPGNEFLRPGAVIDLRAPVQQRRLQVLQLLEGAMVARYLDGNQDTVFIPSTSWHQYQLVTDRNHQDQLRIQSAAPPGARAWAYLHPSLSAEVRYQLQLGPNPVLTQGLWLRNGAEQSISGPGFSFQPGQSSMPTRRVAAEAMMMSSPQEVQQGLLTAVQWSQSFELPAQSEQWLQMAQQPVAVANRFNSTWYLGEQSASPAAWWLTLTSAQALPRLPGSLSLTWFDRHYAQQSSFFQRRDEQQATLALGNHPDVVLSSVSTGDQQWQLDLFNGLPEAVDWQVTLIRRSNNQQQQQVLQLTVPPGTTSYQVELVGADIQYRPL